MINSNAFKKILFISGICLFLAGAITLFSWQWTIHNAEKQLKAYVNTIYEVIPEPQGAALESRRDNTMPTLSVNGTDFIGILEMPRFSSVLPITSNWGNLTISPSLFSGSIYDRTIQIGATSQKGQYDFYRDISVGDSVLFTDMQGNRYTYTVTNIRYSKSANQSVLQRENASLTLFIKNIYSFDEYIIVYCDIPN